MKEIKSAEEVLSALSDKMYSDRIAHNYKDGKIDYRLIREWFLNQKEFIEQFLSPVVTDADIQNYIEKNCRCTEPPEIMMDEQAFYEGAKAMRDGKIGSPEITTRDLKEIDQAKEERSSIK
jgi:hypothetical protein